MPDQPVAVLLDGFTDPAAVFDAIEKTAANVFWLDAGVGAVSGWSFVGVGAEAGDTASIAHVPVGSRTATQAADGAPFRGGWIGWAGYEEGALALGADVSPVDDEVPGSAWMRADAWVAFDHAAERMWAFANSTSTLDIPALLDRSAAESPQNPGALAVHLHAEATRRGLVARSRHTPLQYAALIGRCHDAIRAGDAYQLCLTTRFTVDGPADAVAVYRRLRATSRTGRGALIRIGDTVVCSATPEQFLRVEGDVVRTRPIKGTRPRGSDAAEDAALARELHASTKEQAENVMIVDLMRNDLSRVCAVGTVRVDALLDVESYPHVHQLVSTVSGHLRADVTVGELLRRTFPAGSMTGAPKLSAMTILHELERGPRGLFAGCLGWIGDDGDLDLAMVIRTVVVTPERAYVGAGGGITWSSVADDEVREVGVKARAPLAALGAELPKGW